MKQHDDGLPAFIVMGAMKAGTTTLYDYLSRHPEICMSTPKEPQFFSEEQVYANGVEWYKRIFRDALPGQLRGECSTCYSRWPRYQHVPERIKELNPDAKLIYLLRDPVARSYSHYAHNVLLDRKPYGSFEEALERSEEIVLSSKYMLQIDQYLEHFDASQFLLVVFEDFMADPAPSLTSIQEFLGVSLHNLLGTEEILSNQAGSARFRASYLGPLRRASRRMGMSSLLERFLTDSQKRRVLERISRTAESSFVGRSIRKRYKVDLSPLREDTSGRLAREFSADITRLEHFTGFDLSHWSA